MIKLLNLIENNNINTFYRLEIKDQLKQGKIAKKDVEAASNLNDLAIIIDSWYGGINKNDQLFKLRGTVKKIETHTYQLPKNKNYINFLNKNNIKWEYDIDDEKFIIVIINIPTIEILEQIPINNNILINLLNQL
jgi:hypothetical protein